VSLISVLFAILRRQVMSSLGDTYRQDEGALVPAFHWQGFLPGFQLKRAAPISENTVDLTQRGSPNRLKNVHEQYISSNDARL
jgi:hypothetical protein